MDNIICSELIFNEEYAKKVIPYLKKEYFDSTAHQKIFENITNFYEKYNSAPTKESLKQDFSNKELNEKLYEEILKDVESFKKSDSNEDWLMETTEKFCKDKALHIAITDSISIFDGGGDQTRDNIPEILIKALSVSFDSSIGHSYFDDAEKRYEYYITPQSHLPFNLEMLNKVTQGGLLPKTLLVYLGGTGIGKTLVMCHNASGFLADGKNVLYISMEMSEEQINERIDANLLGIRISELPLYSRESFLGKVHSAERKTNGRLFTKQYPTSGAHVGHFRHLVNELKMKQNVTPDVIFIDYVNICASSRVKMNNSNSYGYIKSVTEEIRGLAVELGVRIISATQVNREGINSSDLDLTNISESMGLAHTADYILGITSTEEMESQGIIVFKQLKNRYGSKISYNTFSVGIEREKMILFDVPQDQDQKEEKDEPVFNNSDFGDADKTRKMKNYGNFSSLFS